MKVRVLNSGDVQHIENSLGKILVLAGLCEELKEPAPKADFNPKWSVAVLNQHGEYPVLAIVLRLGASVVSFTGNPSDVNAVKSWPGGKRFVNFSHECPAAVVASYKKQWDANDQLRGEEIARVRRLASDD